MASKNNGGTPPESLASTHANAAIADQKPGTGNDADSAISSPVNTAEQAPPQVTILICSDCRSPDGSDTRPRPGELLAEATRTANNNNNIHIQTVACLGNCKRRLSASIVTTNCWSYVFGDLAIENASDLIAAAQLMRGSQDGLMPWRGRPQCMKKGLVARLPPVHTTPQPK